MPERTRIRRKRKKAQRKVDEQTLEGVHHINVPDVSDIQRAIESPSNDTLTPDIIMSLQSSHGNDFVNGLVQRSESMQIGSTTIQRMPTVASITGKYGSPSKKENKQVGYTEILEAIGKFHDFQNGMNVNAMNNSLDVFNEFNALDARYGIVIQKITDYLGGKKKRSRGAKKREKFFTSLKAKLLLERQQSMQLRDILVDKLQHVKPQLSDPNAPGSNVVEHGGALNKVYEHPGQGFFKENHEDLYTDQDEQQAEQTAIDATNAKEAVQEKLRRLQQGDNVDDIEESQEELEQIYPNLIAEQNRTGREYMNINNANTTRRNAGIDPIGANTANRDVAMSRLDELLNGGVIAKAEFALQKNGVNPDKEGILMEKAAGKGYGDMGNDDEISANQDNQNATTMYVNDPNFMRQLSRLQLLDALALQVDRNMGNFYVLLDGEGNVQKVTGIDNDMAFGENTDINVSVQEYPGLSQFVDEEMAENILALDENLLRTVMADLLKPDEINALVTRLRRLQEFLQRLKDKDKLLQPDQWDDAIANDLKEENASYFANITQWVQ